MKKYFRAIEISLLIYNQVRYRDSTYAIIITQPPLLPPSPNG